MVSVKSDLPFQPHNIIIIIIIKFLLRLYYNNKKLSYRWQTARRV